MFSELFLAVDWSRPLVCIGADLLALQTDRTFAVQYEHVTVAADIRLDNDAEVRGAVEAGTSASVGELIARAYLRFGETFPQRLAGDFALILLDEREGRILAARDPFGVRPLVYRFDGGRLWLASSVERTLETFEYRPAIDDQMAVEYLLWRYRADDATFFRDIRQIRPGHTLTATSSGIRSRRYWRPRERPATFRPSREDYHEEFRRLFAQAVKRRLHSKSPVLVHVSGGLDSTAIASVADVFDRAGTLPAPAVLGVSAAFPGLPCDEQIYVDAVARHVSFPVLRWDATQAEPLDILDPVPECPGGRFGHTGGTLGDVIIAQSQAARVILSGTGGDQLASSAGIVQDMIAHHQWSDAFRTILLFPGASLTSRFERLKFVVANTAPQPVRNAVNWLRASVPDWLHSRHRRLARDIAAELPLEMTFLSHVQRHRWMSISSQQVARSIAARQRQAVGTEVEFRFPFLDQDLVQFVLSIPYEFWPAPTTYARIHREALKDVLPAQVFGRHSKAEFTPALMNRVLRAQGPIQELLEGGAWAAEGFVDRTKFQKVWDDVLARRSAEASIERRRVWSVVTLEAWMRKGFGYSTPLTGRGA